MFGIWFSQVVVVGFSQWALQPMNGDGHQHFSGHGLPGMHIDEYRSLDAYIASKEAVENQTRAEQEVALDEADQRDRKEEKEREEFLAAERAPISDLWSEDEP